MPNATNPNALTARPCSDGRRPGRPSREMIEQRNRELLDQALDMFLDNGFEATTIDALSSTLGMSRRTIYSRYADKEALFRAALQKAIEEWIVPVEELRKAEQDDLEASLLGIARLWVSNVLKPSGWRLVRIANTEVFRRPEVAAYLWERTAQQTIGYIADLFARRLRPDQAEVPDAFDAAAAFIILVIEGSIQLAVWNRMHPDSIDRQLAYRIRLFLRGAQSPPDPAYQP